MDRRLLILGDHAGLMNEARSLAADLDAAVTWASSPSADGVPSIPWAHAQIAAEIHEFAAVLSVHCRQILPAQVVNGIPCYNLHPGLNPYNRGWFPHVFSIVNGLPAGATLHVMDEEIDHGPIVAQEGVPVHPWDTSETLYARVLDAERRLLREYLPRIATGEVFSTVIPGEGNLNTRADFARLCDLDQGDVTLARLRALTHGEHRNAYFRVAGRRFDVQVIVQPKV